MGNGLLSMVDADVKARVRSEMLRRLYSYAFPVHLLTLPAAFLIATLTSEVVGAAVAMGWAITLSAIEVLRLIATLVFFRVRGHVTRPRAWFFVFTVGLLLSALVWGAAGVLFFPADSPVFQLIITVILVAVAAIAMTLLTPAFWLYVASLGFYLLPVLVMLLADFSPASRPVIGLMLVAVLLLLLAARRSQYDQIEAVASRYSYAKTAESLRQEVEERRRMETEFRRRETANQRRKAILMDLARDPAITEGDVLAGFGTVARGVARGLAVTRVSVWDMVPERKCFRARLLLDGDRIDEQPGLSFDNRLGLEVMRALEATRSLVISDTRSDLYAGQYWEDYFADNGVVSALVTPFRRGGRIRGFLMAESRVQRFWTEDDDNFASSAVDFVSLALTAADRRRVQHRLHEMATLDGLTRLPNRNAFQDFIARSLASADTDGERIGLLFVDLDRFKAVNDSMGHHAGDVVLQEMAQRLLDSTREGDWVARLAGDEFTVIVHQLDSLETLRSIANRIRTSLTRPMQLDNTEITLTCSIGIAIFPDDAEDPERLLQSADAAMYEAKKEGRNRYAFFTPELRERAVRRLSMDTELRQAVDDGDFILHYQPIVRPEDGRPLGVEALIRWQRRDGQMVSPGEFIPLAEDTGLIVPIGEWVLDQTLARLAEWDCLSDAALTVSVNFSMVQCRHGGLPAMVNRALSRRRVSPDRLVAEVTESDVLIGQQQYLAVFDRLREQGVRVAMDDFGTGSSSLGQLKRLPVDILKLDRSFVRDITSSGEDEAITRAAITMADALGLKVIAEGVETTGQRDMLIDAGCRLMQGFYFSRPQPATEIATMLRNEQLLPAS